MHAIMRFIAETPMRVDDVHLVTCPLYHSTAFGFLAISGILGATAVLMDEFKPEPFLAARRALRRHHDGASSRRCSTACWRSAPRSLDRYDTRSLRGIFSGGAPLPGPLAHRGRWITSATSSSTSTARPRRASSRSPSPPTSAPRRGPSARPCPGNEIRLLDDAGREVRAGRGRRALRAQQDARRRLPQRRGGDAREHEGRLLQRRRPGARATATGATSSRGASAT